MPRELPAIIPLLLVSGGDDGKLCWWDLAKGTCVRGRPTKGWFKRSGAQRLAQP